LDDLSLFLCVSIGCVIAWLIALYADESAALLLWNSAFGMAGTVLCALALPLRARAQHRRAAGGGADLRPPDDWCRPCDQAGGDSEAGAAALLRRAGQGAETRLAAVAPGC